MNRFWDSSVRTKTKICGVTELGFAYDCYELGIDALGFHMWDQDLKNGNWKLKNNVFSKITEQLPSDLSLFLLIDFNDASSVLEIIKKNRFDTIQIHKFFKQEEQDLFVDKIRSFNRQIRIVTVISMTAKESS